ncbi:MAG: deoxyribonuclease V [Dehalococcoidales bacterium]|jgi:deoxyribonuclease V|nr:deoxyribonuclease V [Dehalococcoidales bacterium]
MKVTELHGWQVGIPEAREIQRGLAKRVSRSGDVETPRFIAGVDISVGRGVALATGAVVVLSYPELKVVEVRLSRSRLRLPYIPGLLSFREAPLILDACWSLERVPDLILVDGQGISHPRRLGLASHLGLFLDTPTIGCAKSRLCGQHEALAAEAGSRVEVVDEGETIGVALRTKTGVKPVYVSIGHRLSLESAVGWVLKCCRGYRLPEPTRLAHLAAGGNLGP